MPAAFGYTKSEFKNKTHIKDLMPITIANFHDDLIKFYMETGKDKIVHQMRNFFI